ncbi:hypothetical protein KL918_002113 [Ogataea parapolymorpha]|uniref:RNA helicase n=1 Tax=Ogataea parapolymorpha (strain ATCC 26012 / BCRC 20466 / JCM 22074 / NRRL Y-7560 / DL-1) TaxID=871575 RepID=W1QD73_OGAPD|nr:Pre-mRNA-splicing factor ATP-dependent RNA helicase prp16 [Ogataea parapolymorpha DL-1]ESW98499.1 Pre-mRNA-splicing factor ATP-dependent RNA helicase prp16 [Ogataea parapolymorpha DL-1]KAG7868455.1 hypothetical protein KL918_002113 [Ogataea parapolymorpha]KAG7873407.1 hypothetical protein KL916_002356 [Ogataea parapolymorpha]
MDGKRRKPQLDLHFSDEEEDLGERSLPKKPKVTFKKITKADATRLKERESRQDEQEDPLGEVELPKGPTKITQSTQEPSLASMAAQEREMMADSSPAAEIEEESDVENDREWYTQDETVSHPIMEYEDYDLMEHEIRPTFKRRAVDSPVSRSRFDEEGAPDIDLVVHRLTPPFLDSATIMTKKLEVIDTVRDKTGDLYKYSKLGSTLVNERRANKDRKKGAKDAASMNNSRLGKILGGKENATEDSEPKEGGKFLDQHTYGRQAILQQRKRLPAYQARSELMKVIAENQVIVVIGETGSGKTTQIPQFLYDEGYCKYGGLIGVTQPRRVAALSVSKRVSEEMGVKLGKEVGYSIRFEDRTSSNTRIKFMTDGILLREALVDPELDKYSCIVMDEAHERSLNTDILLGLFKRILTRRRDLKLIITSATMNAFKFSRFFGNAEQFTIPGRTYPVDVMFSAIAVQDYVASAVKQIIRVHLRSEPGDILCFMTGQEDIETTCEELEKQLVDLMKSDDTLQPLEILPIYSTLPADLQAKIFRKSKFRKCVVATNIAETSLTVDGIRFVVDTGLMKLKVYNPKLGMDTLQITPISLAQANQRSGRAGRTGPGLCYRLYTQYAATNEMFAEPIPEIQRTNLSNTILLLKYLQVEDLSKFPFLDRPPIETINTAQYDLWCLGALDNFGRLTALGKKMSNFPIDPALSRLLIISSFKQFQCSKEVIPIVAMLSIPPIFVRPMHDAALQRRSDSIREKFQVAESDHLTLVNIFNLFKSNGCKESWCAKNFLQYKSLRRAIEIHSQLSQIMKSQKLAILSNPDWDVIRKCLCASFFHQAAQFKKHGEYVNLRTGLQMKLHPTASLYGMGDLPKYVIYHELLLTGREYMNYVTAVDGEWLCEFGEIFYAVKEKGITSRENQARKERDFARLIEEQRKLIS